MSNLFSIVGTVVQIRHLNLASCAYVTRRFLAGKFAPVGEVKTVDQSPVKFSVPPVIVSVTFQARWMERFWLESRGIGRGRKHELCQVENVE